MLPFLAQRYLTQLWGPFRLLESRLILITLGALAAALITWILLPRMWHLLPQDRGRNFVANSQLSKGKPTGAGLLVVSFTILCAFLTMPFYGEYFLTFAALFAIMLTGYLDDRSRNSWGELPKSICDLVISLGTAMVLAHWQGTTIWLPLIKGTAPGGGFLLPYWLYVGGATAILWVMINVVNCSDGVDGVAGSQALFGLMAMGAFLYGIVGHENIAKYLLLPMVENGASWAILLFSAAGALAAYLWYNAPPSMVMMGDAGSRFYGLLLGIAIVVSGNPFMALVAAPILCVNGGAGLVKLVILRILKKAGVDTRPPLSKCTSPPIHPENFATDEENLRQILIVRALHRFRFPIHDHCRKDMKWSDSQVLLRFMLLKAAIVPLVIILLIKLR